MVPRSSVELFPLSWRLELADRGYDSLQGGLLLWTPIPPIFCQISGVQDVPRVFFSVSRVYAEKALPVRIGGDSLLSTRH